MLDLLEKRKLYPINEKNNTAQDNWLEEELSQNKKSFSIITTESAVWSSLREQGLKSYYIHEAYGLSNPPLFDQEASIYFTYYHFSKEIPEDIYIGQYRDTLSKRSEDNLPLKYKEFLQNILKTEKEHNHETYWISKLSKNSFDQQAPFPRFHSPEYLQALEYLKQQNTLPLNQIVNLLLPESIEESRKVLNPENFSYPLDYNTLKKEKYGTDTKLQKGDILLTKDNLESYLVYEQPKENIYASVDTYVFRPKDISPEFFFLHLQNEKIQLILKAHLFKQTMTDNSETTLNRLPVIVRKESSMIHSATFYAQYFPATVLEQMLNEEAHKRSQTKKKAKVYTFSKERNRKTEIIDSQLTFKATLVLAKVLSESYLRE